MSGLGSPPMRATRSASVSFRHAVAPLAGTFADQPYPQEDGARAASSGGHLIAKSGWEAVRVVFGTVAALPKDAWPRDDLEQRSLFLEPFSAQVDAPPPFAPRGAPPAR
jgi:hypothetical protein